MLKVEQTGGKEKQLSPTGQKEAVLAHAGNSRMGFPPENTSNVYVGNDCREIKAGPSSYKGRTHLFSLSEPTVCE